MLFAHVRNVDIFSLAGVWTLKAKGQKRKHKTTPKNKAKPTFTHMAIVQLEREGKLKYLVSQNCDGLHIKSGFPPDKISELHGNTCIECCAKCGKLYYRGVSVRSVRNPEKLTGRKCDNPKCKGYPLRYTTVAFSQSMPDRTLDKAEKHSLLCDLSLTMGTSMRVTPSCELPLMGRKRHGKTGPKRHRLVIVNLQKTPYDSKCALRIFAKVDVVMALLMEELGYTVPEYKQLDLINDSKWQKNFAENYKFRSAPDTDWFKKNKKKYTFKTDLPQ
eukprot:TRINITY_DN11594_c0_g1_i3.p1 TRINITY_DN11594_c0_g1~~TRINITY_DN11594_c0_g1_i3.p1  ORF type:complete len:274 (-),score=33.31 TRINITY_DN11594_c0_g1_i3:207-1028(-)